MLRDLAILAVQAGTEEESSKVLFYVLGGLLALWAVVVSVLGITRHERFPPTPGVARAIMAIGVVLVVGVMASTVLTA